MSKPSFIRLSVLFALLLASSAFSAAPSIDASTPIPSVAEEATTPPGAAVNASFTITGDNPIVGVVIIGNYAGITEGVWQFSSDSGTTWANVGCARNSDAVVLSSSTLLRFKPGKDFNGTPGGLEARGVDNTYASIFSDSTTPTRVRLDVPTNGGASVSTNSRVLTTTITSVNDAPIATADSNSTNEDTLLNGASVLSNDTDNHGVAMSFDGNDQITINRSISTNFTIEFWMKTTQSGGGFQWYNGVGLVDAEVAGETNDFGISLVFGQVGFGIGNPDATVISDRIVNDNRWHHVAAVRNGNQATLYLDGYLAGQNNGVNGASLAASSRITFGSLQTNLNYYIGQLDDIRIWSTARTLSEIRDNMSLELAGTETGLEDYYTFNGTSTAVAVDLAGGNNNGTINGATPLTFNELNTFTASLSTGPAHAQSFALNSNGTYSYTPALNYFGSDSFTYKASDTNDSNDVTVTLAVNPQNDAPVLAAIETAPLPYATGAVATQVTNTLTVSDVDDTDIESASISITNAQLGDILELAPQGTLIISNSGTASITITGTATKAVYEAAFRAVTFRNTGAAVTGQRSVAFSVNDGSDGSNTQTRTVAIFNPANIFVDPNYTAAGAAVTFPFSASAGTNTVGVNAFAAISDAVNAVTAGQTIHIASGTYAGFGLTKNVKLDVPSSTATISGNITGANGFECVGAGTLELSGADNTYAGTTTVTAGYLRITGQLDDGGATDNVIIAGGTLEGTGTVSRNVSGTTGFVNAGTSPGILIIAGNYDLSAGLTNETEIITGGTTAGTHYDQVQVGGNLILGGTSKLRVDLAGLAAGAPAFTVNAITWTGTRTGTFGTLEVLNNSGYNVSINYNDALKQVEVNLAGATDVFVYADGTGQPLEDTDGDNQYITITAAVQGVAPGGNVHLVPGTSGVFNGDFDINRPMLFLTDVTTDVARLTGNVTGTDAFNADGPATGAGTIILTGTLNHVGVTTVNKGSLYIMGDATAALSSISSVSGTTLGIGNAAATSLARNISAGGVLHVGPYTNNSVLQKTTNTYGSTSVIARPVSIGASGSLYVQLQDNVAAGTDYDLLSIAGAFNLVTSSSSRITVDLNRWIKIGTHSAIVVQAQGVGTFGTANANLDVVYPRAGTNVSISNPGGNKVQVDLIVPAPSIITVDGDWAGLVNGDTPPGLGNEALRIGYDAFATVNAAMVQARANIGTVPNPTISVRDFNATSFYAEDVLLDIPVAINGNVLGAFPAPTVRSFVVANDISGNGNILSADVTVNQTRDINDGILLVQPVANSGVLTLQPGGTAFNAAGVTLTKNIELNVASSSATISGGIHGAFSLAKRGTGELILTASSDYSGPTSVTNGILNLVAPGAAFSAGTNNLSLSGSSVLRGAGSVAGNVSLSVSATHSPDPATAFLTVGGNYALNAGTSLNLDVAGTSGVNIDSIHVTTGTVTLAGSLNVDIPPASAPPVGTVYTVIDNQSASAVIGTFAGLAEGALVNFDGIVFRVSYVGGTGSNDVTLTVQSYDVVAVSKDFAPAGADTLGQVVTLDGGTFVVGSNAFNTIQQGVNAVTPGNGVTVGIVKIDADTLGGNFAEAVTLNKNLKLQSIGTGIATAQSFTITNGADIADSSTALAPIVNINQTGGSAVVPTTPHIHDAILLAADNAATVVNVASGTYIEQIQVAKSLHLLGAGSGTTNIVAPTPLVTDANGMASIIRIGNTLASKTVEVDGFTVNGAGAMNNGAGASYGIFARDGADVLIENNSIIGISNPLNPQGSVAVQIGRSLLDTSAKATINNNSISGYGKNGITIDGDVGGAQSEATITGNTITGAGKIMTLAQNGIQISRTAKGSVSGNTISGNYYTGAGGLLNPASDSSFDGAAGILVYHADNVSVTGNTLSGNQASVWSVGSSTFAATFNTITGDSTPPASGYDIGIAVYNEDQFSFGLGFVPVATTTTISNNLISGHDYGVLIRDDQNSGVLPVVGSFSENSLSSNGVNLHSASSFTATTNWWGSRSGPASTGVSQKNTYTADVTGVVAQGPAVAGAGVVNYVPWLVSGVNTPAVLVGFDPLPAAVTFAPVSTNNGTTAIVDFANITDAIANSNATATVSLNVEVDGATLSRFIEENIPVNKAITIQPETGSDKNDVFVTSPSQRTANTVGFNVTAANVTITNITIDGDLSGAANGYATAIRANSASALNTVAVTSSTIRDSIGTAVQFSTSVASTGLTVTSNVISGVDIGVDILNAAANVGTNNLNVAQQGVNYDANVAVGSSEFAGNTITSAGVPGPFSEGSGLSLEHLGAGSTVLGNIITLTGNTDDDYAIFVYEPQTNLAIRGNAINTGSAANANTGDDVGIGIVLPAGSVVVGGTLPGQANTLVGSGEDAGIYVFGGSAASVQIVGNSMTQTVGAGYSAMDGFSTGVFITDAGDFFFESDTAGGATLTNNVISGYRRGVDICRTGSVVPSGPGANLTVVIGGTTTDSNTIQNGDNTASGAGIRVLDIDGTAGFNAVATITGNVTTVTSSGVGIDVTGGTAYIANNTISGNSVAGVRITNGGLVSDAGAAPGLYRNTLSGNGVGVLIDNAGNLQGAQENFITNSTTVGILIDNNTNDGVVSAPIFNNSVAGPATSIENQTLTLVNASANWFGVTTQTDVTARNLGNVDYSPWLQSASDTDNGLPAGGIAGFQGDFSILNVYKPAAAAVNAPGGFTANWIQEAVSLVFDNDSEVSASDNLEIRVWPTTGYSYTEETDINNALLVAQRLTVTSGGTPTQATIQSDGVAASDAIFDVQVSNVTINNLHLLVNGTDDTAGINAANVAGLIITRNTVEPLGASLGTGVGIHLTNTSARIGGVVGDANSIQTNQYSVHVDGLAAGLVEILFNTFPNGAGVRVNNAAAPVMIADNTFTNTINGPSVNALSSIGVITVNNNNFNNATGGGVNVANSAGTVITNNDFTNGALSSVAVTTSNAVTIQSNIVTQSAASFGGSDIISLTDVAGTSLVNSNIVNIGTGNLSAAAVTAINVTGNESSDLTISFNELASAGGIADDTLARGVAFNSNATRLLTINNNIIVGFDDGVLGSNAAVGLVNVFENALGGNSFGITSVGATLRSENNWWGLVDPRGNPVSLPPYAPGAKGAVHPSNPGAADTNVSQSSDFVDFSPWLGDGRDTSPVTGFQPNNTLLFGLPDHLVFTKQPLNTAVNAPISPSQVVEVTAYDDVNNVAFNFTGTVTIALEPRQPGDNAKLSGTTVISANQGVAVFSNLSIDTIGTAYKLRASALRQVAPPGPNPADSLPLETSATFDIIAPNMPAITNVVPSFVNAGSPATQITISATDLYPASVVLFNGIEVPSQQVNGVILATIPANLLAIVGDYSIVLRNGAIDSDVYSHTVGTNLRGFVVNDIPSGSADVYSTPEDIALNVSTPTAGVLNNDAADTYLNGFTALVARLKTPPGKGVVTLQPNGTFLYWANPAYSGPDAFEYVIDDGYTQSAPITVTINVTSVNDAPIALNDTAITPENVFVDIAVLTNDSDPEGNALTIQSVNTAGTQGTVVAHPTLPNVLRFTPATGFTGATTFMYTIVDNGTTNGLPDPKTATTSVAIYVNIVNDPPSTASKTVTTAEDTAYVFKLSDFAFVDADPADVLQKIQVTSLVAAGSLTLNGTPVAVNDEVLSSQITDGLLVFSPAANANGSPYASFSFRVSDGAIYSAGQTMTVNVTEVNDAPVATNDSLVNSNEDATVTVSIASLLVNDLKGAANEASQTLSLISVQGAVGGSVAISGLNVVFTPTLNFNGAASFTYTIQDNGTTNGVNEFKTATATVSFTINATNDAPVVVVNTGATVTEGGTVLIGANALAYSDVEGDTLTYTVTSGPLNGSLTVNGVSSSTFTQAQLNAGVVSYTHNGSQTATGTFGFSVTDSVNAPLTGSFVITVNNTNDLPTSAHKIVTTIEDTPYIFGATDFTYSDEETALSSIVIESLPATGLLALAPATPVAVGQSIPAAQIPNLRFTPAPNANGTPYATFQFRVSDGTATSALAYTITVNVSAQNDDPTSATTSVTLPESTSYSFRPDNFPFADVDAGDSLQFVRIVSTTLPPGSTLTLGGVSVTPPQIIPVASLNTLVFTPVPLASSSPYASFVFQVGDGTTYSISYTMNINVLDVVNNPPLATNNAYSVNEDGFLVVNMPANGVLQTATPDTDPDGDPLSAVLLTPPQFGTLTLGSDGTFTYRPLGNYNGTDSFEYRAFDGQAYSAKATVTLTVNAVNDDPFAFDDTATTGEDTAVTINVLTNDGITPDTGETLTIVSVSSGINGGSTAINGTSTAVIYTPAANYVGLDSFTYIISDGNGGTATATVVVTVNSGNNVPTAVADAYTLNEDQTLTLSTPGILSNDTDADNETLTAVLVASPANGSLSLGADGSLVFVPDANFNGTTSFTYRARDSRGVLSAGTTTVTLNVTAVNDNPIAVNDTATTAEDTLVSISVLTNDSFAPDSGETLTIVSVTAPIHGGSAVINGSTIDFTPATNFTGIDSFSYTISDGTSTATATVVVNVTGNNAAPIATIDTYTTDEDQTLTISAPGILGNDTDADNEALTAVLVAGPANGSLSLGADGSLVFVPNANFNGSTTFTYQARDSRGALSATTTVTLNVTSVNDNPFATDDIATTGEDAAVTINVLTNDGFAPDTGETLTIVSVSGGINGGSTVINGTSTAVIFTPAANYVGLDSFTYTISDGNGGTATATVVVTVSSNNAAPTAVADSYTIDEDQTLTVSAPGILGNDSDADGETLTAVLVTSSANGVLSLGADGSLVFIPNANFNGSTSFTYQARDTRGAVSAVTTVTLNVTSVNDPVVAVNDTFVVSEDPAAAVALDVLANDSDADNTPTISAIGTSAAGATLTFSATGITYLPPLNFFGPDTFTYTITDGATTSTATVTVVVTNVNDNPVAGDDTFTIPEGGTPVTLPVLANDNIAPDVGEVLTIDPTAVVIAGGDGTVTVSADGKTLHYAAPSATFNGQITFVYGILDGNGGADTATVTINVTNVNNPPVAANDTLTVLEDAAATTVNVLANDSFAPDLGETLTVTSVTHGAHGTVTLAAGTVQYKPVADYFGSDTFTYTISDGNGGTATATVVVTVTGTQDAPNADDVVVVIPEGSAATVVGVLASASDVDGDALTVSAVQTTSENNGTVTLTAGVVRYTPAPFFNGSDAFTYTVSDGTDTSTALVIVIVPSVNDNPTANADAFGIGSNSGANVLNVLANDTALPDVGETLTVTNVSGLTAGAGTVAVTAGGSSVTYTPAANFTGAATFTYTISDGNGGTANTTVTLTVASTLISVAATNNLATEKGSVNGLFTITRQGSTSAAVTVAYTIGGTATNGTDYTTIAGTVQILAGQTTATVSVAALADTVFEGDETVTLTLTANAAYAIVAGGNTATVTILEDDALVLVSGPTATPNPALTNSAVQFACASNSAGTTSYVWDFGDGSNDTSGAATVSHAYTIPGQYDVKVTATSAGSTVTQTITVAIVAAAATPGADTDNDGVSDEVEVALGTDPFSAASSPVPNAANPKPLTVAKMTVSLNFTVSAKDSISIQGLQTVDAAFLPSSLAGKKVVVDVGGVVRSFTIDAKGKSKNGGDSYSISKQKGGVSKFLVKITKGTFATLLSDEKLTNTNVTALQVAIPVNMFFNGEMYRKIQVQSYTAKQGKSGKTK